MVLDKDFDKDQLEEKLQSLADSVNESEEANRMQGQARNTPTKQNRLERLACDIQEVFEDLPIRRGLFHFAFRTGQEQRFMIDDVAYIVTDPETRVYEFNKETRLGTALLGRTPNRRHMAKLVTRYVSEKLLDEQHRLESELISLKFPSDEHANDDAGDFSSNELLEFGDEDLQKEKTALQQNSEPEVVERVVTNNTISVFAMLTWFVLGVLAILGSAVFATLNGKLPLLVEWLQSGADAVVRFFAG